MDGNNNAEAEFGHDIYRKQVEKENEKLQEENEKLKEELLKK